MTTANNPVTRLSQLGVIDVLGEDAEAFLQGQFCNDLAAVAQPGCQLTGYCSPKGRLLATPSVWRLAGGFRLIVPTSIMASFVARLRMFVLRADVRFEQRDDLVAVGIFDATCPLFASAALSAPDAHLAVVEAGEAAVTLWEPGAERRWMGVVPSTLLTDACEDTEQQWRLADIRAGIPNVVADTQERFIPQMLNLAAVGGLSFTKGCYPGQEIVARTQYLGKLKKHMQRFVATGVGVPAAGDVLGEPGSADAAEVVDAVAAPDGSVELLAVVRIERDVDAPLILDDGEARPAGLPYGLAAETATP